MESILIEHKNHDIYFQLAHENLIKANNIHSEIIKSNRVVPLGEIYVYNDSKFDTESWLKLKLFDLKKSTVASIIFSALTAESFINYYALSNNLSQRQLETYGKARKFTSEELSSDEMQEQFKLPLQDRTTVKVWKEDENSGIYLSGTVRKWIEIPKLITGNYIPSGLNGSRIHKLNELFVLRNNLVHHKATIINLDLNKPGFEEVEDKNYVTATQAKQTFNVVIDISKSLKKIDAKVDLEWLNCTEQ